MRGSPRRGGKHEGGASPRLAPPRSNGLSVDALAAFVAAGGSVPDAAARVCICRNKSSLATILANPIYRGVKIFNRETRVEGEHGRKRRRNPAAEMVTSEIEAIVPEQLWDRVQAMLVQRRENRLPPMRYRGGYVLTDLLRCACGSRMAGTNSRSYRYYRCTAKCGRPHVRANQLEDGVMDLVRHNLITPKAIREMVEIINEDIRLRAERQGPDLAQANARVRQLEREDANLRRALRTATPRAAERIQLEIDAVADELSQAKARLNRLDEVQQPMRITPKLIRDTIEEMSGLVEHAGLDTRVAWVRDLFERIDVDSREEHAVAVWKATNDEGVNRSDSVTEWLRRAGAGHLLRSRGESTGEIPLPRPTRSREWLKVALLECRRCHQVVERSSPVQRHCPDCRAGLKRARSRNAVTRARAARPHHQRPP